MKLYRRVVETSSAGHAVWNYSDRLECGHWVDYKTFTARHPARRNCDECVQASKRKLTGTDNQETPDKDPDKTA